MNWQQMISDLLDSGMQQQQLAEKLDCSQTYISDLYNDKRGKRVSYELGIKIIKLHKRRVPREAATP